MSSHILCPLALEFRLQTERKQLAVQAMTERARRLWESGVDDDDEDEVPCRRLT